FAPTVCVFHSWLRPCKSDFSYVIRYCPERSVPTTQPTAFDTDLLQIYHPRRMGQRSAQRIAEKFFALAIGWLTLVGCDRADTSHPTTVPSTKPTVASLVP